MAVTNRELEILVLNSSIVFLFHLRIYLELYLLYLNFGNSQTFSLILDVELCAVECGVIINVTINAGTNFLCTAHPLPRVKYICQILPGLLNTSI